MTTIDSIGNNTTIIPTTNKKVNFRATANPYEPMDVDTFIKQQKKEQKKAKINQGIYYAFLGTLGASAIASIYYMRKQNKSLEKPVNELKEIWSDLTKSSKLDDMALPDSLKKFTSKFKNSVENPDILKARGGRPTKSLLLYGPPGTGKTTFAKALAKEFPDSKFASLDVTSLGSEYQSVSERNLNKAVDMICQEADKDPAKKFFVFIDEIDSVMMVDNGMGAKHSNDMLNEFKKCFTEKLGKRKNIITIGATNLPIDVEKGIALGGKKLDRPMLDRFSEKVLVDLPTKEQIANSVKYHYRDANLVSDKLKNGSNELNIISEFLAKKEHNTSFRTLDSIYDATAASIKGQDKKVDVIDIVRTIANKQNELNFDNKEFMKLISDLKINPSEL